MRYTTLAILVAAGVFLTGCLIKQTQKPAPKETLKEFSGIVKTGKDLNISYCQQGIYLETSEQVIQMRELIEDGGFSQGYIPYIGKKVKITGIYPAQEYACDALICACEDFTLVKNISLD